MSSSGRHVLFSKIIIRIITKSPLIDQKCYHRKQKLILDDELTITSVWRDDTDSLWSLFGLLAAKVFLKTHIYSYFQRSKWNLIDFEQRCSHISGIRIIKIQLLFSTGAKLPSLWLKLTLTRTYLLENRTWRPCSDLQWILFYIKYCSWVRSLENLSVVKE